MLGRYNSSKLNKLNKFTKYLKQKWAELKRETHSLRDSGSPLSVMDTTRQSQQGKWRT